MTKVIMTEYSQDEWVKFRDELVELRGRARALFIERWPVSRREEAEIEFYNSCMAFQLGVKEELGRKDPSLDVDSFIAWHIVAGSTGIDYSYAPQTDLPDGYSHKAFMLRVIVGEEPALRPPSPSRRPRQRAARRKTL